MQAEEPRDQLLVLLLPSTMTNLAVIRLGACLALDQCLLVVDQLAKVLLLLS